MSLKVLHNITLNIKSINTRKELISYIQNDMNNICSLTFEKNKREPFFIRPDLYINFNSNIEKYFAEIIFFHLSTSFYLIDEKIKVEEYIIQSEQNTKNISFIVHEIKTPLTSIISMSELSLETDLDDEQKEYLNIIHDSGRNQLDIIAKVLDYCKIDNNRLIIDPEEFNLNDLFNEIIKPQKIFAESKNLNFVIEKTYVKDDLNVYSDKKRLFQICSYLLSNAIKFSDSGEVKFRYGLLKYKNGFSLNVEVIDNGIGIKENDIDKIFKVFTQLTPEYKDVYGYTGTGLSLFIVKNILKLMGTDIGFESNKEQTSFFTEIPLSIAESIIHSPINENPFSESIIYSPTNENPFSECKILLADDNAMSRITLSTMLSNFRFKNIDIVDNGLDAQDFINKNYYDILILDDLMPGKYGVDICLEEKNKNPEKVIIIISAGSVHDRDYKKYKPNEYIKKPIEMEDFKNLMYKWAYLIQLK